MSIVFGCAHIDQGRTGMTEKTLSGLLLALLYLASGRNLGMPMIARFSDSLDFMLIYLRLTSAVLAHRRGTIGGAAEFTKARKAVA